MTIIGVLCSRSEQKSNSRASHCRISIPAVVLSHLGFLQNLFVKYHTNQPGTSSKCGPGSSVGIATDYGLDGPGIEAVGFFIMEKSTARSLSVFRLIPEQFQTNKYTTRANSRKKKPVEVRFFAHVQPGPGSCTMGTGSFPGVKRPGRGADHPPPSSAEVKNE
jgi:hypothetical protein